MADSEPEQQSLFPHTRWSLVVGAQAESETCARRALGELCQFYWYPLYTYARRRGLSPQDSEDRVQGFFAKLLGRRGFDSVSPEGGRLRAFLQASMKNFLAQEWHKENRQKRGAGAVHIPIDQVWAEQQFNREPAESESNDRREFDRSWAYSLLHRVFDRLEAYYNRTDKREIYESIKGALTGDGKYDPSEAEKLGLSNEGVRSAVFKLRRRFREYVEEEIRETCSDETEAREEIHYLCQILAK